MVATGARARALSDLLEGAGWATTAPPRLPRLVEWADSTSERVRGIYDSLGGHPDHFPRIRPGGWDLAVETGEGQLLVELDEEQHFTRYRSVTLDATEDLDLPWASTYPTWCRDDEARLLPGWGSGQRWTNPSAARFFGDPSPAGDFSGAGAPRWRQRAFYDAVKDVLPGRALARISVHDSLAGGGTVESLLRRPAPDRAAALQRLILERVHRS